jgi:acetoin utilization protein AcuB
VFVANRMTRNPIVVAPNDKVDEAAAIMKEHGFRRLPVVDEGLVVGFLSDRDLMKVMPSPATTLSKYEVNSLLAKMTVKEIMTRNVITVSADAPIEEAALIMYKQKIGGMPVLSSTNTLVGIITETDIFKAFVDIMILTEPSTRITISGEDAVGVIHGVTTVFTDMGINIMSLVSAKKSSEAGKYDLVVRAQIDDVEAVKAKLAEKGYNVISAVKIG